MKNMGSFEKMNENLYIIYNQNTLYLLLFFSLPPAVLLQLSV